MSLRKGCQFFCVVIEPLIVCWYYVLYERLPGKYPIKKNSQSTPKCPSATGHMNLITNSSGGTFLSFLSCFFLLRKNKNEANFIRVYFFFFRRFSYWDKHTKNCDFLFVIQDKRVVKIILLSFISFLFLSAMCFFGSTHTYGMKKAWKTGV